MRGGELSVVILGRTRRRVSGARLRRTLAAAARELGVAGELVLVLAGDRRMRTLNAAYRKKDRPTDVLSFPGPGGEEGIGDVVIGLDAAERNARRAGHSLARELEILALHGLLHSLGYDHETDDGAMERLEARLRARLLGER